jgi:hypothetical protein
MLNIYLDLSPAVLRARADAWEEARQGKVRLQCSWGSGEWMDFNESNVGMLSNPCVSFRVLPPLLCPLCGYAKRNQTT